MLEDHKLKEADAMFWAESGGIPWHNGVNGIGVQVADGLTATQALGLVNARGQSLNWTLEKQALLDPRTMKPACIEGKGQHQLIRSDNNEPVCYSTEGYEVFQNHEQAELCDRLVEKGAFKLETAGSLKNGRIVWFLGRLQTSEIIPGDFINHYVFIYTSHDGSGSLRLMPTDVRVVCNNTVVAALYGSKGKGISIRHTKNMRVYLEQALLQMSLVRETTEKQIETYKQFAGTKITAAQVTDFSRFVATYGLKNADEDTNRIKNKMEAIEHAIFAGDGQRGEIRGVRGTAWAAYNGLTQWVNRERSTRGADNRTKAENRLVSLLQGSNGRLIAASTKELKRIIETV